MRGAFLGLAAAVSLFGGVALAQEPPPAAPGASSVFDWNGFYVGVQAGGAWGDQNNNLSEELNSEIAIPECLRDSDCASEGDFGLDGVVGGAHAGFNIQSGPFVFGLEGEVDGSGVD
jgi:outer membrane immunogenic protein